MCQSYNTSEQSPDFDRPPWDEDLPRVAVNPEQIVKYDYRRMHICYHCYDVEGWCWDEKEWRHQINPRCPSNKDIEPNLQNKWDRYDFNEVLTLCYCCASEILDSGSRWSVWFCEDCKQLALQVNGFFERPWLPIGRHSLMNRILILRSVNWRIVQKTKADIRRFSREFRAFKSCLENMQGMSDYAVNAVKQNLRCLCLNAEEDIPLPTYMRALQENHIDKKVRFLQLCQNKGIPWWEVHTLGFEKIIKMTK